MHAGGRGSTIEASTWQALRFFVFTGNTFFPGEPLKKTLNVIQNKFRTGVWSGCGGCNFLYTIEELAWRLLTAPHI